MATNLEEFKKQYDIQDFINFHKAHSVSETAERYGIRGGAVIGLCKTLKIIKDGDYEKHIPSRQELYQYYIEEDHGYYDSILHFGITDWMFTKLKQQYGIKKDKSSVSKKMLQGKYEEMGSRENYYSFVVEKINETKAHNYGSVEAYNEYLSKKEKETWGQKSEEEKKEHAQKVLQNGGGWNHSTAVQTLKSKYGVNNAYALSIFKSNSKTNREFQDLLEELGLYKAREVVIGREGGGYFRYDFLVEGNVLIEINPSATHSSSWSIFKEDPLDRYYHRDKTLAAIKAGYTCICLWDWSNKEEILNQLQSKRIIQRVGDPRRHLVNLRTREHVESFDKELEGDWIEVWDDGSELEFI